MSGKVLIVDGVSTNRIVLKVKLAAAGYEPILAADGAACLKIAAATRPDLILLDLMLNDMPGIDVLHALKQDTATRRIPVIMFSAVRDGAARLAALRAGVDEFLTKPINDQTLLARLRSFMRAGQAMEPLAEVQAPFGLPGLAEAQTLFERPGLVGLVTARPETALRLRHDLQTASNDRFVLMDRAQVLRDAGAEHAEVPDVYVIEADIETPNSGLRLMSELRSRPTSRDAAFCILNQSMDAEHAAIAFDLGADDQISGAMHPHEMALRLRALLRRKRDADRVRASVQDGLRLALIDPLTGLHNRRYAVAQLAGIADKSALGGAPYAVMVADLDRFKTVNDRWGHAAGDAVLIEVAGRLSANLRMGDLIARIGGEEFLIALPATEGTEARQVAERLCRAIEETPVVLPDGARLTVTISIGLAVSAASAPDEAPHGANTLVDCADRALRASKSAGRNMVTISRNAA